jgi:hydrazine synthase alpha subunit-like protein
MICPCNPGRLSSVLLFASVRAIVMTLAVLLAATALASDPSTTTPAADMGTAIRLEIERDWLERGSRSMHPAAGKKSPPNVEDNFSFEQIRRVIQRAKQLAERLRTNNNAQHLDRLRQELQKLSSQMLDSESNDNWSADERQRIYLQARWLARRIAFTNRLLDFDQLLLVKRHDAAGVFHMCDQFYGCNAVPGGGLYVLSDPFGPNPKLTNLLQGKTVAGGRLDGQHLSGGSFLAPEISFDGSSILFAYCEAGVWDKYQGQEAYEWTPECTYHIFKCNADGTDLVQLTDGPWDDFDPCFLPNGRIAFISLRRGGYLRCGRHCPVYTLHSMSPDGSGMTRLSHHETHEWQPSVNNDGMIVFTRWDYVDRDTNIAHHIWTCFPDGRDARSFHGNYPERRESRPWMEMDIRAIPGSHKYVATAAAHHGHAFGSLVLIDPHMGDDNSMSQLTRLTPEAPFPEAEGEKSQIRQNMVYGTAWPLSEDDFLCAYDAGADNHGIYWIDSFGNRELIYRDREIASVSPIPLRPRIRPPIIPDQNFTPATAGGEPSATVVVSNVYDSDFQWPDEMKIEALRIIQLLPKTTPAPNNPRIGVANQTNARAVLGTVPVEKDGSAHFRVPAGKEIYFQALDSRGMAVQSMRSGTYLHPGERMACQGCHEHKQNAPQPPSTTAIALQRPPSTIQGDVDGSSPFNYVRLVQPVLDRNCVGCHDEKNALDLSGTIEGPHGWTRSYGNLAADYGFYFHVSNGSISDPLHGGSRTTVGMFGARASKLLDYTDERHYGVKLSAADLHRLALWLDCNSEFFGSYENIAAQSRGEVVRPTLD